MIVTEWMQMEQTHQGTMAQIEQAKQEWEATADSLPELVCLLDDQQRILRANRTLERWELGNVTTIKGQAIGELFHPGWADFWQEAWDQLAQGHPVEREVKDERLQRHLHVQLRPIAAPKSQWSRVAASFAVVAISDVTARVRVEEELRRYRDQLEELVEERTAKLAAANEQLQREIAERVRADEALRQRNRELTLLNRVIATATSAWDVDQVLQIVCQELARAFDLPQAAAALLNAEGSAVTVVTEYLAPGRPSTLGATIPLTGNPAMARVLEQKAPLALVDAQADERQAVAIHDLLRRRGTVSLLIVPIVVRDQAIGTIGLDAIERREFSRQEIALAQSVAAAAGQALESVRLYQEFQRHAAELERHVAKRTAELRQMVKLMAGREVRMAELKQVVRELREQLQAAGLAPITDDPLAAWQETQ